MPRFYGRALAADFISAASLARRVWHFTGIALFLSLNVDQRNHRAIDFVIGSAIGAHAEQALAAFLIGYFAHVGGQCLDYVAQNILQIGDIDVGSEFGDAPSDIRRQDVERLSGCPLTFRLRGHVLNNDLQLVSIQAVITS
jgi:hypothetical protein